MRQSKQALVDGSQHGNQHQEIAHRSQIAPKWIGQAEKCVRTHPGARPQHRQPRTQRAFGDRSRKPGMKRHQRRLDHEPKDQSGQQPATGVPPVFLRRNFVGRPPGHILRQRAERIREVVFETGRRLGRHPGSREDESQDDNQHQQITGEIVGQEFSRRRLSFFSPPTADQQKEQDRARFEGQAKPKRVVSEKQAEEGGLEEQQQPVQKCGTFVLALPANVDDGKPCRGGHQGEQSPERLRPAGSQYEIDDRRTQSDCESHCRCDQGDASIHARPRR